MSETAARASIQAVLQQIVTDHTSYLLAMELDNRVAIDQGTQQNPYLHVEIDYLDAYQADMADHPRVQNRGQIVICAIAKSGAGARDSSALRDFVIPYFNMKTLGTVVCQAAEKHRAFDRLGWQWSPILINFWQTDVSG